MAGDNKLVQPSAAVRARRRLRFLRTRLRELRMIGKALVSTKHPILVHVIPNRRCNLACTYCNEFDDFSKPVPLEEMKNRLDILAGMGTSIITISGGEPLMHPEIDQVIRHIRRRGMIAGMITNGFLLDQKTIEKLNAAGLEHLQISIDNAVPDEVSLKSLKTLDTRLEWLAQYAVFQVNINSVLGSGVKNPEDALKIAHRAVELGFTSTVGIIHDHNGRCRSGSRYLYICEDGLVHWCSQQRGYPGIPLTQYTPEMRRHEYFTDKFCAPRCTVSCVQQVGILDNWRDPQTRKPKPMAPPPVPAAHLVQIGSVRSDS